MAHASFFYLPQATLALIIIVSVANLIRFAPLWQAWKISRQDGVIGLLTFVVTSLSAPDLHWGIALGMGLSLALNFYRTMRPNVAFLTRHLERVRCGMPEPISSERISKSS